MNKKDVRLSIRFSEEERKFLEDLSQKNNESLSQYVRKMLFKTIFGIRNENVTSNNNSSEEIEMLLNKIEILTEKNEELQRTLNKVFVLLVKLASKDFDNKEIKDILESALNLKKSCSHKS